MSSWRHWFSNGQAAAQWSVAALAATVFVCGLLWQHAGLLGLGAGILCLVLRRVGGSAEKSQTSDHEARATRGDHRRGSNDVSSTGADRAGIEPAVSRPPRVLDLVAPHDPPLSTDALVDDLFSKNRYALLLRTETKQHLTQAQILRAIRQLDEAMALVPAGRVLLGQLAEQSHSVCGGQDVDPKLAKRNLVQVEPVYLDRFCVTNEQFQQFIDAAGYEQLEFWPEESLPALLDFVDQTGAPGPRYWSDGQYSIGDARLPVVGISWYEASAYARWVGKKLPTDAEWTKAGSWPVESSPGRIAQRRYPWGESFDVRKAHLFGSNPGRPVAVDEFPGGVSVGGIHQLIGNVWEWTSTPLAQLGDPSLYVSESMISIRGGAFDTYFENQATCHYQSGEHPLSRRPNIGFRLALPMRDLEDPSNKAAPQSADEENANEPELDLAVTG